MAGAVKINGVAAYAAMHGEAFESAAAGVIAPSMNSGLLHKRMGNRIIATDLIWVIPSFLKRFDK